MTIARIIALFCEYWYWVKFLPSLRDAADISQRLQALMGDNVGWNKSLMVSPEGTLLPHPTVQAVLEELKSHLT